MPLSQEKLTIQEVEGLYAVGCTACGQSRPRGRHSRSKGLRTPSAPRFITCHINHRRPDVPMAKELLHRANVVPVFQQVRCEAVSHAVATRVLRESSPPNRPGDGTLDRGFVQVKAGGWIPFRISADSRRRKHELPAPLRRRSSVLAIERERQHDASFATREVALMLSLHRHHTGARLGR